MTFNNEQHYLTDTATASVAAAPYAHSSIIIDTIIRIINLF